VKKHSAVKNERTDPESSLAQALTLLHILQSEWVQGVVAEREKLNLGASFQDGL